MSVPISEMMVIAERRSTPGIEQSKDRLGRDKATRHQPQAKQVANPLRVLFVVLVTLNSSNPFGRGNHDIDFVL